MTAWVEEYKGGSWASLLTSWTLSMLSPLFHKEYSRSRVTALNKQPVDAYVDIPYVETKCGYSCSDQ